MDEARGSEGLGEGASSFSPGWYRDPWTIAPWRWWDGKNWTAVLYGEYGEAWPLSPTADPLVAKGPGIKGGGIAALGACVGLAGTLAVAIVVLVVRGVRDVSATNPWFLLADQIPHWIGFVGAVLIASRMNGSNNWASDYGMTTLRWRDLRLGIAGGVLGRVVPILVVLIYVASNNESLGGAPSSRPTILGVAPSGIASWVIMVLLTVLGAPIIEELFFRGLVQGALTRRLGANPALFITALGFSLIHITDHGLLAPVVLFPIALILGYLKKRTGRLSAGIIAHAMFNASLLVLFFVPAFR